MQIKATYKVSLLCLIIFSSIACNHATQNTKSYTAAFANDQQVNVLENTDHQLLQQAFLHEHYVLQMATEAKYRSTAPETIALANSMVENAENVKQKLSGIAEEYGLTLQTDMTPEQKNLWKLLVKEKGWEFDKHFSGTAEALIISSKQLYENAEGHLQNETLQQIAKEILALLPQQIQLAHIQEEKVTLRTSLVKDELAKENITKLQAK